MKNKLSIVAISDLHGYLPEITEEADIMIIGGDISPLNIQRNKPKTKIWLETTFLEWVNNLPVKKVFLVAGNHDFALEGLSDTEKYFFEKLFGGKLKYLENETFNHVDDNGCSWVIFGTPYCHIFSSGWVFMIPDDNMYFKFLKIPDEVDIIISHDPPYGVGEVDVILEQYNLNEPITHIGNKPLAKRLQQIKYKFLCCGHIHSGSHIPYEFNGGKCVNVSIKDEDYQPIYHPFYYTLEK